VAGADERREPRAVSDEVTQLLHDMQRGDADASARLVPIIYRELRRIAGALMRSERAGHTLQPTAVVNEALIRLMEGAPLSYENRAHFFAVAARTMRRLLVDHARRRIADKRGGEAAERVELEEGLALTPEQSADVLALHEALERLERIDERQSRVVEMHYFAGNSVEEIAQVLDVSPRTVKRELQTAKLFLRQQLKPLGTIVL
jgi:RNA polymerase sigma factor (TIGR02999 family)